MFKRKVDNATVLPHTKALIDGQLTCVLVDRAFNDKWRTAAARVHFHNAVAQIAIFHGRNTCNDLHALNVRRAQRAGAGAQALSCC